MNRQFVSTVSNFLDLSSLKDQELGEITHLAASQLVGVIPGNEGLIRFWGVLLVLLDDERQRRCEEVAELERLFFGSAVRRF